MSIAVEVSDLPAVLADVDPAAYICTSDPDGRPKIVHVLITVAGDGLITRPGRGTVANIDAGSSATLVFPGVTPHEMSLLVDAEARTSDAETVRLDPTSAVWHRSAHGAAT